MPGTSVQQGDISEEEKEWIRNMQLDESKSDVTSRYVPGMIEKNVLFRLV